MLGQSLSRSQFAAQPIQREMNPSMRIDTAAASPNLANKFGADFRGPSPTGAMKPSTGFNFGGMIGENFGGAGIRVQKQW